MRSSSSSNRLAGINTILNQTRNSSGSNKSSGISRKPTSALSKIGKHVPPPISPITAFKSTTATTTSSVKTSSRLGSSGLVEHKNDKTSTETLVASTNSTTTCAWRIPKVSEPQVNQSSNYPQRKVPELTPVPVAVKEPEKPKGFLERFEEFPNLLIHQTSTSMTPAAAATAATTTVIETLPIQRPPQKLLGGDFNFLEDDDWLDGDTIDYSQNLFEDDNHFLPSYTIEATIKESSCTVNNRIFTTDGSSDLCHVKAKSLLAERHHSSKKKDIWKRTEDHKQQEQVNQQPKIKIKILKRPDQSPAPVIKQENADIASAATVELTRKISTSLKLKETETLEDAKLQEKQQEKQKPAKIVYSSASKTLKKM